MQSETDTNVNSNVEHCKARKLCSRQIGTATDRFGKIAQFYIAYSCLNLCIQNPAVLDVDKGPTREAQGPLLGTTIIPTWQDSGRIRIDKTRQDEYK